MNRATALLLLASISFVLVISCGTPSELEEIGDPTPSTLNLTIAYDTGHGGTCGVSLSDNDQRGGKAIFAQAVWTQCPDSDFSRYIIYRSTTPGIESDPSVADTSMVFNSVSETSWLDYGIAQGITYYYALRTLNTGDMDSWSNEEMVTVPSGGNPTPSTLSGSYTGDDTWGQITLDWTQCPDADFHSYSVYRSLQPGIQNDPGSAQLIDTYQTSTDLTHEDNDVSSQTTYYYAIETRNQSQQTSWSNEITVTSPSITPMLTVFFIDPSYGSYSGDAILLRTPDNGYYLIDGGQGLTGSWSCGEQVILPLLDSLGVDSLSGIVGTHPHSDHIGGLVAVLDQMPVGTVWDSGWPYSASWIYDEFLGAIVSNGADYVIPRRGDMLPWGDHLTVECIHPVDPMDPNNMNNASITLLVTYDNVSFLFTGDLETSGGEDDILDAVAQGTIESISAQVLKVGHHGSHTSTSWSWLQEVDPVYGAIEVGSGNPYGHPHTEVLQRLANYGTEVYRTDLHGTFIMATDGNSIDIYP